MWNRIITAVHISEPLYTPRRHTPICIYTAQTKNRHIYLALHPPIGDSTSSRQSGNRPNHRGTTYTMAITVTQSQTQTHMPEETRTSTCCGKTHQDQAERQDEPNHSSPIQYASPSNIESFFLFSPYPRLALHTYTQSRAPTVILPTITGFY